MVVLKCCIFLSVLFSLSSFADSSPVLIKLDNTKGHNNPIGAYYDKRCGIYRIFQGGGRAIHVNYNKRCPNNFIGLKSHDEQPQYYYECKKDLVVFGRCPYLHVFDKISNKCRYQRYVDLDVDIVPAKCKKEGKFPVRTNCSLYYICDRDGKEFRTKVFRCPGASLYSPDISQCSHTSTCSPSTIIYDDSIKSPDMYDLSFPGCSDQGIYRTRSNCSLYYNCTKRSDFGFIETRYMCPSGKAFSIDHQTCLLRSNVLCEGEEIKDYEFGDVNYSELDDYDNETGGCKGINKYTDDDNMVGSQLTTIKVPETTTTEEGSGDMKTTTEHTTTEIFSTPAQSTTTEQAIISTLSTNQDSTFSTIPLEKTTILETTHEGTTEKTTTEIEKTTTEIESTTFESETTTTHETTTESITHSTVTNLPESTVTDEITTEYTHPTTTAKITPAETTIYATSTESSTIKPNRTCVQVISHCDGYNNNQCLNNPNVSLVPENQSPVETVVVNIPQKPIDIIFKFRPTNKSKGISVDFFHGKFVDDKPCVINND